MHHPLLGRRDEHGEEEEGEGHHCTGGLATSGDWPKMQALVWGRERCTQVIAREWAMEIEAWGSEMKCGEDMIEARYDVVDV